MDEKIKELLIKRESLSLIRAAAKASGMKTLREDGVRKIKDGTTSIEEVTRETKEYV